MSLQDGGCSYTGSANMATISGSMRRRLEDQEFTLRVYPGSLAEGTIYCPVTARKNTTAAEAIECLIERLHLDRTKCYVLAEVKEFGGEEWILNPSDCPVQRMMLWPRTALENRSGLCSGEDYRFLLREKNLDGSIHYGGSLQMWLRVTEERRRMVERGFLPQPAGSDPPCDLCALPELTERALLESLRARFRQEKIYTYVGSILIVINPFQFLPIYNPKYVKMYDNHTLGKLEPHIYAVADVAYHAMLQRRKNQCIVISGESGSGKTQSTNFLIHHLTALSQKGFASGVEQIILGAGPVLEAFGNAKTAHNNNSSRFGKFIQVNYQESGTVRGAYVEKYLLEKSRLVYQEHNERNYHVFYYLLAGASEEERKAFHLLKPEEYHYLNQVRTQKHTPFIQLCYDSIQDCFTVEGEDLKHDFERLQLAMEMVGFLPTTRKQIFSLLSAILHLGNIRYKKKTYRDDSIDICNPEVLPIVSELLEVKEEMLLEALTTRKTVTVGERLIVPYKLAEAGTVRDSMAKSLYSALFDWIVFRTNHALLNNKDLEDSSKILSIGVLDIFGFEDYENNSFEQFCINFANERLQHYFNQHIFKLEQEEYRAEGITWHNIDYIDNSGCINLISKKPTALFHLLDEECNFPQASNQTLLDKFKRQHEGNSYIEFPTVMEPAFIIRHYAGKVKYGVKDFREKNTDHMRPDIVALLKSSKNAFICGLMGIDPVATFRWAVLRAYFRAHVAFREAGRRHTHKKTGNDAAVPCAVVKTVDSFSFLHHPVHQRSLEILQRCKDEKYSITRKNPRTPLSDLQGTNALNEKASWDGYSVGCNGRTSRSGRLSSMGSPALEEDGIFLNSNNSKLLERAQGILMFVNDPGFCAQHLLDIKSLRYLSSVTLHDRITKSLLHLHKKKKPPSISAQFQASLNKLMETLDQSEPYFVKCIRSNAEKLPLRFNDSLVLRQLRYTGMLETVRIRQSGYSSKYTFQDFVHHFHVLLPRGTSPTKSGVREFFRRIHLPPAGYQVGSTMVFLREAERQRLQTLLHQEVLRRIVMLQRRFRAVLERKHFVNMRRAACTIQRWWRFCLFRQSTIDLSVEEGAALCLQAAWRGYRERRKFLHWRDSAIVIQRSWKNCCHRRALAATAIQTAWKGSRERRRYHRTHAAMIQLQARSRGYLARLRFRDFKEQHERLGEQTSLSAAMESYGQDISAQLPEDSKSVSLYGAEMEKEDDLERSRSTDESSHKNRSKRESRRMRELEQAQFSLELLKVRSTSLGGSLPEDPVPNSSSSSQQDEHHRHSPQGSPASQGSFEVLSVEDMETEGSGGYSSQLSVLQEQPKTLDIQLQQGLRDSNYNEKPVTELPNKVEAPRATFYIASDQSPAHEPKSESPSSSYRERRESTSRRPVVVLISMQKESPLEEGELLAAQTLERASQTGAPNAQMTPIAGLEIASDREQPLGVSTQAKRDIFSSHKDQKKIHKTMSSGDLGKMEILRKTSSQDGRMRGKMRFWSKTKHSEKKLSREKQAIMSEQPGAHSFLVSCPSPPHSPDLEAASSRGVRDSKENKEPSPKMKRRRSVKISSIALEPAQWQNDALHILTSAHDYRSMNDFLMKKIADLDSEDGKKDTMVDVVFKKALKEFRINIFNSYSTALAMDDGKSIRYKDLYALFEHILEKTMRMEQRDWSESPVKVWVNTFKVFLDEFMTEYKPMEGTIGRVRPAPKRERKKSRKKETDIVEEHNGHIFKSTQYSIPTYCEYCSSLIWMMDRACVCKLCRYACHRKCCSKMTTKCSKKYDPELSSRQFGVELSRLTSEERTVPQLVEKLINYIEMHGLYTEGIYRKSGSTNKIKELRQGLDTDVSSVNLDDYNIHVIASVLKQWLRDLPSPLMTFELYEEFLRAMGQPDKREVINGVYSVIDQLSRTHLSTLERLIFHLVRIALQEETNRMSANALAIVFAPCILRCPDSIDPLQSVQDISKTTACVELIINEQMSKYKARLKDISSLEFAENKAKSRLTHIRRSMSKSRVWQSTTHTTSPPLSPRAPSGVDGETAVGGGGVEDAAEAVLNDQQELAMQQEERILAEQIESLQKEKEELTYEMLILEPRASDDETPESEASIGTADSSENITMDTEGATSDPSGACQCLKSEAKSRRALRRQPDSQDSADSTSTVSSYHPSSSLSSNASGSPSPHYRFRSSSSGPLLTSCSLGTPLAEAEGGQSTGKTRHRLRLSRSSPREPSGSHRRESDFGSGPQQLVLYGNNEFMV
uniref:Unconventional myosin-IXa-like n=1 Tax=Astatotilapia calliptera TaxID=8154 RepID=A0A3P8R0U2_ASTCA